MADKRSTGWKIPLLFCAVVLLAVGITALLREEKVTPVEPNPALMQQAMALPFNLEADEEGRRWKGDIAAMAGAMATRADKDKRLQALANLALEAQRYDAACTIAVVMYSDHLRDSVLESIALQSMEDCGHLPWALMAAAGMKKKSLKAQAHQKANDRWEVCAKQPAPEGK